MNREVFEHFYASKRERQGQIMSAVAFLLAATLFCSSCAKSNVTAGGISMDSASSRNMKMQAPQMAFSMAEEATADGEAAPFDGGAGSAVSEEVPDIAERKLVRTANITIKVSDLQAAETAAIALVKELQGYVANSSRSDMMLSIDIKVPLPRFDDAVAGASDMGTLVERNVNAADVTDRYYDLDSRIRTKKILKERLESYLSQSANMKDLVAVETQLNAVISDLEAMQGQFKRLNNQIDYSTISICFILPAGKSERGWRWPSITSKARAFVVGAAGFFSTLVLVVLGIALFGTPVVLLCALVYCLTFGKVGWVKHLFKRMKE